MSATLSWRDDCHYYGNDLRWRTGAIMQAGKHSGDILEDLYRQRYRAETKRNFGTRTGKLHPLEYLSTESYILTRLFSKNHIFFQADT
jgi:hypothetical protein